MAVNKVISEPMLVMWCKKCWKFLDYAQITGKTAMYPRKKTKY
jgi:hypothetical protein